jgi:hypothetical protein
MAHSVTLTWQETDTVDGYNLYRSAIKGAESTKINPVLIVGLTYVDASPLMGESFYEVKAVVGGVESPASNEASAVLLPSAPTQLVATAG